MSHIFIQGASRGLGREFVNQLLARGHRVTASCRQVDDLLPFHERLTVVPLDLEDPASIDHAATLVSKDLDWIVQTAGLLHAGDLQPEKKLDHANAEHLARLFQVNAIGPLLVAKAFQHHLADDGILATLSARVGSIEDNGLGGWYGYRASKAAQNMFTKNLSIEWKRRRPARAVVALHPGTVATDLSEPFRRHAKTVFSPELAVSQLIAILDGLTGADTGRFIAWDGTDIPW